jgi:hypothetical protein
MNMPQAGMGQLEQFVSHKRAFDHKSIPKRRKRSKQRASQIRKGCVNNSNLQFHGDEQKATSREPKGI